MSKPDVLIAIPPHAGMSRLAGFDPLEADFTLHYAGDRPSVEALIGTPEGAKIRAAIVSNGIGLNDRQIRGLPALEFVQTRGMGFDNYGLDAMRERGIVFANNRNTNNFSVAEHAMAILLTIVRDVRRADADIRAGKYVETRKRAPRALIYGKKIGILGLGDVGLGIAKRAEAFEATIAYHNRKPRTDVPYPYVDTLLELARQSDILVIAVPGGPETKHMVNREVIEAIGPDGYLVNVGRGSVVKTDDLVAALHAGKIAGAALDVIEGEPDVPQSLLDAPNVILTPHLGSSSKEARMAAIREAHENLKSYFAGRPVANRIAL